jgi:DNA polymerase III alpha subunit
VKTELNNRALWFDGTSEVSAELVPELLLAEVPLNRIVVTVDNDDVIQFNLINDEQILSKKIENDPLDLSWNVPAQYMEMDLCEYIASLLQDFIKGKPEELQVKYINRVTAELHEIRSRNIEPLFKTLIYVVGSFKAAGTVWGVGRGSSCASLVLHLIGLHAVDPIKYGIPLSEFFHD